MLIIWWKPQRFQMHGDDASPRCDTVIE